MQKVNPVSSKKGELEVDADELRWRRHLRMTAALLLIWFATGFVVTYFARELSFSMFGWPLSFWIGAQGALIVFVLIVWFYAAYMDKEDREGDRDTR